MLPPAATRPRPFAFAAPDGVSPPPSSGRREAAPEHWSADAGTRDVVRLDIPADASRERRFEVDCQLSVVNRAGRADATHGLQVRVDGALEWERTVPTQVDGFDSLELRLVRTVPVGRPLRIAATCVLHGAQRTRLRITADET